MPWKRGTLFQDSEDTKIKNIQHVPIICKQIESAMVIKEILDGSSKLILLSMQKK